MLSTAETSTVSYASVETFDLMRGQLLSGARLKQVKALQDSIARFGLLSPVVAIKRAGKLVIVDGRKRLAAIRRLAFQGRLPRSLAHIPYVLASDLTGADRHVPIMVSNQELFQAVQARFQGGAALDTIATEFHISRQCVRDMLALSRLDGAVRRAFFERLITFPAALAYAALPDRIAQRRLLGQMGPFATPQEIARAAQERKPRRADIPVPANQPVNREQRSYAAA